MKKYLIKSIFTIALLLFTLSVVTFIQQKLGNVFFELNTLRIAITAIISLITGLVFGFFLGAIFILNRKKGRYDETKSEKK